MDDFQLLTILLQNWQELKQQPVSVCSEFTQIFGELNRASFVDVGTVFNELMYTHLVELNHNFH
jgi:hypothetical protein